MRPQLMEEPAPGLEALGPAPADAPRPVAGNVASPRCILVVGMHRSGTSPVTRTLHTMGAAVPGNLIEPYPDNPDGFWESRDIVRAHERFLAASGSNWDDPRPLADAAYETAAAQLCKHELMALLRRDFAGTPLYIVKDPRICKLLPIWKAVLQTLGAEPCFVIPLRNPEEVARSLGKRNGTPRQHALALWLVHALMAERESRGFRRVFTRFEAFVEDPVNAARELCVALDCFAPANVEAGLEQIEAQWSRGLRHHSVPQEAFLADPAVPLWVRQVYGALLAGSSGGEPDAARLDDIWEALQRSFEVYGSLVAVRFSPAPRTDPISKLLRKLRA